MSDQFAEDLARRCAEAEVAARAALAWFARYPETVGAQRPVLDKEFRMNAVDAGKLAQAARRPMAVGVYGLSQAGKSYLIATLARRPGEELRALLDQPRGFLADINPESEKEATGLVTRFTMRRDDGPEGFPVRLRLLSETDLVKILANSWYRDSDDPARSTIAEDRIEAVLAAAEQNAGAAGAEVLQEDVWDLQVYWQNELRSYPTARSFGDAFWDRAAAVVPRLALAQRIAIYALLWHDFAPFTAALSELCQRLQALRFDREVWAPIAALVPKTESILRVDTLGELGVAGTPVLEIRAGNGARCTLTRAELTALTAELQITMAEQPWPMFAETDLLDFPGAKSREGKNHAAEIAVRPNMLGEFFLRGKVAYLFERYAMERELNVLLLCIGPSNNAYDPTIRTTIRSWIARTHGERPDQRERVDTAMFLVLTKMDMHFMRSPGRDAKASSDDLWEARIKASVQQPLQEAAPGDWLDQWHRGRAFTNTLLARNPEKSDVLTLLDADGRTETGFRSQGGVDLAAQVGRWGREFAANPAVRTYIADPARVWGEVFRLTDAGMSYLVERLTPVCRLELKQRQIENQLTMLSETMHRRLEEWHVSDDLDAEVAKRQAALDPVLDAIEVINDAGRFGRLIAMFHLDPAEARQVLLRGGAGSGNGGGGASGTAGAAPARVGGLRQLRAQLAARAHGGDTVGAKPEPSRRGHAQDRADTLIAAWIGKLRRFAADPNLRGYFGLEPAQADTLVAEIIAIAERTRLHRRIVEVLQRAHGGLRFDQAAERRAALVAQMVNEQVNFVGLSIGGVLAAERPSLPDGAKAFERPPPPGERSEIADQPEPYRDMFCLSWADALVDAVERNVRARADGGSVDQAQNEALGAILARL
jgi:hypothetical protein